MGTPHRLRNQIVWKLWVHPYMNSTRGEFVSFVTKARYNKLLREYKTLEKKLKELKND